MKNALIVHYLTPPHSWRCWRSARHAPAIPIRSSCIRSTAATGRRRSVFPTRPPLETHLGWTMLTYSGDLPVGTITSIQLGLHVESAPLDPVFALFDNVRVNDKV